MVELCLRSVEGLVLHRPQELPAVAACLGVLPRSAVSQFVESLLLKSMTGLYPLPSLLGRLHDCFPASLLADCTLTCRNRGHLKQFSLHRGWESRLACAPYFCDGCQVISCHDELSQCVCNRWLCELCSRFESFFWKWGNLRGRVCAEGCPSKVAQKLMKRKRGTSIGPDLAWCERDDLTRCFNCGCTIWDMGEYRKGMTNDEVDDVESSGFFLSCHVCDEQSCSACARDCPECGRHTCKRCRVPCSSCGKKRVCGLCLRPREALADEVGLCWDCQDQDRA